MSTLVAGPWVGEFGYELFRWQAHLRAVAKQGNFSKVVVSSRPGTELLYQDFATDFIPFNSDINPCEGHFNDVGMESNTLMQKVFAGIPYTAAIDPRRKLSDEIDQDFIKFGCPAKGPHFDVVIHARHIRVAEDQMVEGHSQVKENRNWLPYKWHDLAMLMGMEGIRACSIGHPDASLHVEGTMDYRGISLEDLADVLASSRCILGPSSGPMHFATLCGCKQIVWGTPHLLKRYNETWNPFGTPVTFIPVDEEWNPAIDMVFETVRTASATWEVPSE